MKEPFHKHFNIHTTKIVVPELHCVISNEFCVFLQYFIYDFLSVKQVIPKSEILRLGVLEQSKEEVIVQVSI